MCARTDRDSSLKQEVDITSEAFKLQEKRKISCLNRVLIVFEH